MIIAIDAHPRRITAAILTMLFATAAPAAKISPQDAARILPASQVKAGMRGYGLTVFKGDRIDRFDVKVLGVLPNANAGKPLILVRIGGSIMGNRQINIAEGMSGSPVYIGDKIIGAIAYAGNFAREPLGLVTPIDNMLDAWDPTLPSVPPGGGEFKPPLQPIQIGASQLLSLGVAPAAAQSSGENMSGDAWFHPLSTPIVASGFSQRTMGDMAGKLGNLHASVRQGPGRMSTKTIPLREGSAVGFSLVTGDVDMTAIGTITYRNGERVLAFGHPFLTLGPIELPMSTAWVHEIFTSYNISYKMASPVKIVGSSSQDRLYSVAGSVGKSAGMLPVDVTVHDDGPVPLKFHANIAKHPLLTPLLTRMVAEEALIRKRPYPGEGMAIVTLDVEGKGVGKIRRSDMFFSPVDISTGALGDLTKLLSLMQSNKFYPVEMEKLSIDVKFLQTRRTAEIEQTFINKSIFEPGQTIEVSAQIRPFHSDPILKTMRLKIPDEAIDGRAILMVSGGGQAATGAQIGASVLAAALGTPSTPEDYRNAATIRQLLDRFEEQEKNSEIVTKLLLPSASFNIEGQKLVGLPPVMENAIDSIKTTGTRLVRDEVKAKEDTGWLINGSQMLTIIIQKKSHSEKAKTVTTPSPRPQESTPAPDSSPTSSSPAGKTSLFDEGVSTSSATLDDGSDLLDSESDSADPAIPKPTTPDIEVKDEKPPIVKPVQLTDLGHTAHVWLQSSQEDFLKGEAHCVAVGSNGSLRPGFDVKPWASLEDLYVWSLCPGPDGSAIAGTGSRGWVWQVMPDGKAQKLFQTSGSQAAAVVMDAKGRIWAGSAPDGSVWTFEGGNARKVAELPTKHVTSLALDENKGIFAGAGDSGKVWHINLDGEVSLLADTYQLHIQCLYRAPDGVLYAGTAAGSGLWEIKDGQAEPIFKPAEEYVCSIVCDMKGRVYAATGPKGKVYRIVPGKTPEVMVQKLMGPTAPLSSGPDDTIVVLDGSKIHTIYPVQNAGIEDSQTTQDTREPLDFFSAVRLPGGEIAAGTTNKGGVWQIASAKSGWFESTVRDAQRPSAWGSVRTQISGSKDGAALKVRTGNTDEPDKSWSPWKPVTNGGNIGETGARFAQYRLELNATKEKEQPKLEEVAISYLPANQAPAVKFTKPAPGTAWSGKQEIKWAGSDPDMDKLTYELSYSADDGKTWKSLDGQINSGHVSTGGARPGDPQKQRSLEEIEADIIQQMKQQLEQHPEIPNEVRQRVLDSAPAIAATTSKEQTKPSKDTTSEAASTSTTTNNNSYQWNTAQGPDGSYWLKVVASDALANATGALSAEATVGPIQIVNTKPAIRLFTPTGKIDAKAGLTLKGSARSKRGTIAAVQYRLDGKGNWAAAEPADGIFDSGDEAFIINIHKLTPGQHTIEAQVKDAAGNTASTAKSVGK